MKTVVSLGALALALAAGIVSAQQPIRVGLAFDAGGKQDRSFNQSAFEAGQRAAKQLKAQVRDFEPSDPSQVGQGIRAFAQNGFDLIVGVGFANEPSITAMAKEFPDINFALVDSVSPEKNVASLVFREQEGSYLVGYIAGKTSSTGIVGFVGGMDIPLIHKFEAGYTAGVRAACPTCRVVSNYVGNTPAAWNNPTQAKEIAANQASQGADIIYAAAGASGNGVQDFVKDRKCITLSQLPRGMSAFKGADRFASVPKAADYTAKCGQGSRPMFFIGVDSNQNRFGDTDNNPRTLNHGLTSMLKRVDNAVYSVIQETAQGKFQGGERVFTLANNGVGYAVDEYNRALLPAALVTELNTVRGNIVAGRTKVPAER